MANNVARAYIQLDSNTAEALQKMSTNMDAIKESISNTQKELEKLNGSVSGFATQSIASFAKAYLSFQALKTIGEEFIGLFQHGLEVNIKTQNATNAMAGLLTMAYTIKDVNGKALTGADAYNEALIKSKDLMAQARAESMKSGIEVNALMGVLKTSSTAFAHIGASPEQMLQLASKLTIAGQAYGISGTMLTRDINDLVSNSRKTAFSSKMGFTDDVRKQYQEAINSGKALEFLNSKLEAFNMIGEQQANSLGGAYTKLNTLWDTFAMDVTKGMSEQLEGTNKDLNKLFDFNTKDFTDKIQPIIDTLNGMGDAVGQSVKDGFHDAIKYAEDFATYLKEDHSAVGAFAGAWDSCWSAIKHAGSAIGEILIDLTKAAGIVFNLLLPPVGEVRDQMTGMQELSVALIVGFSGIATIFGVIEDIVRSTWDIIKVIVGAFGVVIVGTIDMVIYGFGKLSRAVEDCLHISNHALSDSMFSASEGLNKMTESMNDMMFKDNETLAHMSKEGGVIGFFHNTNQASVEAANAVEKAMGRINSAIDSTYHLPKKNPFGGPNNTTDPASLLWTPNKSEPTAKEDKSDPIKQHFNDMLKQADRAISQADKLYSLDTENLNRELKAKDISNKEYFAKKAEYLEKDIQTTIAQLNKEIKITEDYLNNKKHKLSAADKQSTEDKLESLKDRLSDYNVTADSKRYGLGEDKKKSQNDLDKQRNSLESEYLNLMGQSLEADEKKINYKYDELLKDKNISDDLKSKISLMKQEELINAGINDKKNKEKIYSDQIANSEAKITEMQKSGQIGELDALAQIQKIRQKASQEEIANIKAEIAKEQEKIDLLKNNGGSSDAIQSIQNNIDSLNNKITTVKDNAKPLSKVFNDVFTNGFSKFTDDIVSGNKSVSQSFKDLFKGIEGDLMKMIGQNWAKQLEKALFGGKGGDSSGGGGIGDFFTNLLGFGGGSSSGGGGFSLSGLFSGMFADGGMVLPSDKPILVGERGPEIWQPSGSGRIINNNDASRLGGGGGQNHITVHVHAKDIDSFRGTEAQLAGTIQRGLGRKASRVS